MREGFSRAFVFVLAANLALGASSFARAAQANQGSSAPSGAATANASSANADSPLANSGFSQALPDEPRAPTQPEWYPLPADQEEHVNQLLDYWQQSSDKIRTCTCDFTVWHYDPQFCAYRNPQTQELLAYAVTRGEIRYAAPDKAMFEETELWRFALDEKSQPGLEKNEDAELLTKWMCDGNATYSFDSKDKKLTEIEIPAEFHGDGLVNSPLPFLFGANRQVLLSRYWIRPITPANATDEYWLLAVPKRIEDARTFSHVELIIARQDFLPKSMIIYPQGYDPKEKPVSHAYVFENRKINNQLANLKDFMGFFIKPKLPRGWEWVKQKAYADEATAQRQELEKLRK